MEQVATALPAPTNGLPAGGPGFRTRVVLLGTAGGPQLMTSSRFGVSTAIVYGENVYLVDLGAGSPMRLIEAGLSGGGPRPTAFQRVRGIFITHMHSDHIVEWPMTYAIGAMNTDGSGPIEVFGPGDRGSLPRMFPPGRPEPALFGKQAPTAGITGMTALLTDAFAADFNDRARDSNAPDPSAFFRVHDIDISAHWDVDPAGIPPRLAQPLEIWQDGDVRVTATLVDHRPTAPAFAFRFDTPDGAVVVSGDTRVSENLIDLARDADYLVHEVIDRRFVEEFSASMGGDKAEAIREHLLNSHTTIEEVGRDVAEVANVKNLVLNHLAPANNDPARWQLAQEGFSGRLIVGEDLMDLGVGVPARHCT